MVLARLKADKYRQEICSSKNSQEEIALWKNIASGSHDIIAVRTVVSSVNRTVLCLKAAISVFSAERSVDRSSSLSNRQRLSIAREKADIFAKLLKLSREHSSVNRTISPKKERLLLAREK